MGARIKSKWFFDKEAVIRAVDKATRVNLSKIGAFIRTAARSSIRTRRKPSQPGQPPSSHTGLLKNNIFFEYDPNSKSVVIGPALLKTGSITTRTGDKTVPSILENGGLVMVRRGGRRNAHYVPRIIRKRPYMLPAREKGLRDVMYKTWKDSVKNG